MENPRISVIIPVYNREKFISKTIQSVLNQTFKNFELIIVDDCSTDNTVDIIRKYQNKDKRIKLFRLNENSGSPEKPRNLGVKNSTSDHIFFLDSDDILLPTSLEERMEIFLNTNCDIVNANCFVVDTTKMKIIDYVNDITSSYAIKRNLFNENEVGLFNENGKGIGELEWLIRYICFRSNRPNIFYFEKPTILYFRHKGTISDITSYDNKTIEKFLNRNFALLDTLSKLDQKYVLRYIFQTYFWIGHYYGLLGNFSKTILLF